MTMVVVVVVVVVVMLVVVLFVALPLVIGRYWSTWVRGEVSTYHETPSLTMCPGMRVSRP